MIRPPSAAVVSAGGVIRPLVTSAEPHVQVTEEEVKDAKTLARMMADVMRAVALLDRRPCPRRIDHEGLVMNGDGTTQYLLPHDFGGQVRWWVCDCTSGIPAVFRDETASTDDVLVLVSSLPCTVTIRIEEVGG